MVLQPVSNMRYRFIIENLAIFPDATHATIITTNNAIAADGGIYNVTCNFTGSMPALNIDTALTLPSCFLWYSFEYKFQ